MNNPVLALHPETGKTLQFDNEHLFEMAQELGWVLHPSHIVEKSEKVEVEEVEEINPSFDIEYLQSILKEGVRNIRISIANILDKDTLKALRNLEIKGKARKTVLNELDNLI